MPTPPPRRRSCCKRRQPTTQAHTWPVLPTLGCKGGGKEGAGGLPFLYSMAGASMQKARSRAAPRVERAMAESFSVLGCGSTCPPLPPPPRGAGKRHLAAPAHWLLQTTTWQRWGRRPPGERGGGGGRQWLDEWRGEGEKEGGGDVRGGEEAVAT